MKESRRQNYDLEERTAKFGEAVITFCQSLKYDAIRNPLINQLVRSSTSIGANYMEANASSSRKDFRNKIYICKKESQETKHWLRMLASCEPERKEELRKLWKETEELTLIFGKIISSLNNQRSKPAVSKFKIRNSKLTYDQTLSLLLSHPHRPCRV